MKYPGGAENDQIREIARKYDGSPYSEVKPNSESDEIE